MVSFKVPLTMRGPSSSARRRLAMPCPSQLYTVASLSKKQFHPSGSDPSSVGFSMFFSSINPASFESSTVGEVLADCERFVRGIVMKVQSKGVVEVT